MRYFELWLQETDEPGGINDFDICIRGVREPSLQEADEFTKTDREHDRFHVKNIIELSRQEAEDAFDFSNEDQWPIFGQ